MGNQNRKTNLNFEILYMGGKVEQMRDETNDRRTQTLRPDDANKYIENGNETLAQTRKHVSKRVERQKHIKQ